MQGSTEYHGTYLYCKGDESFFALLEKREINQIYKKSWDNSQKSIFFMLTSRFSWNIG